MGDLASAATEELRTEVERLRQAIRKHWAQKCEDRCFLDDGELYAAAGLPPADVRVGDKAAMLANCAAFIEKRCAAGGPWKSYAELEAGSARQAARVRELEAALAPFADLAAVDGITPDDSVQLLANEYAPGTATVGDCRRAAELLANTEAKECP